MKILWEGGKEVVEFMQLIQRFLLPIGEQAVPLQPLHRAFVRFNTLLPCDIGLSLCRVVLGGILVAQGGDSAVPWSFPLLKAAWGTSDFQTWGLSSFPIWICSPCNYSSPFLGWGEQLFPAMEVCCCLQLGNSLVFILISYVPGWCKDLQCRSSKMLTEVQDALAAVSKSWQTALIPGVRM